MLAPCVDVRPPSNRPDTWKKAVPAGDATSPKGIAGPNVLLPASGNLPPALVGRLDGIEQQLTDLFSGQTRVESAVGDACQQLSLLAAGLSEARASPTRPLRVPVPPPTLHLNNTESSTNLDCTKNLEFVTRETKTLQNVSETKTECTTPLAFPFDKDLFTHNPLAGAKGWNFDTTKTLSNKAKVKPRLLLIFVQHDYFHALSSILIVFNTITMGAQVQHESENLTEQTPDSYSNLRIFFTLFFITELALRLTAFRRDFFVGEDLSWNMFDTLLILASVIEFITNHLQDENRSQLSVLRILRVLRLVRIMRIIRVFKFFRELRMMVYSIFITLKSLLWAIILISLVIYVCAIYLTESVAEARRIGTMTDLEDQLLDDYFGNLFVTMYTLFQCITGGANWGAVADPLVNMHWSYAVTMSLYIAFTSLLLLNVVTAVFVESAMQSAQTDNDFVIQLQMEEENSVINKLQQLFNDWDHDNSGFIDAAEFQKFCNDYRAQAIFRSLGVQVSEAVGLFRLLDLDGSGEVSTNEFVLGCLRLKGGARNVDVATLMYENKKMMKTWFAFMKFVSKRFDRLAELQNYAIAIFGGDMTGMETLPENPVKTPVTFA